MKHLIKKSLLLVAVLAASSLWVSCVEDEKEPSFSESGTEGDETIDVKMPAPGSINFNLGSEVVLKGNGFSSRDKVYVQQRDDYDGEGGVATGRKIQAEINHFSSSELTFIIPGDLLEGQQYGSAYVYFKRDGKEYKLGYLYIEPVNVYLQANDPMVGDVVTLMSENSNFSFSNSDKVFLQKSDEYSPETGIGEKIKVEIKQVNTNQLEFVVPKVEVDASYLILLEHNGVELRLNEQLYVRPLELTITSGDIYAGGKVTVEMRNQSHFSGTEKIYLQRMAGYDEKGNIIGSGEKFLAEVVDNMSSRVLTFEVPVNISGDFIIIVERDEVEYLVNNVLDVRCPVEMPSSSLTVGEELALYSIGGSALSFDRTDKVYLQPVVENGDGGYTDKGSRKELQITRNNFSELYCIIPSVSAGTYVVILVHKNKEYRAEHILYIYSY